MVKRIIVKTVRFYQLFISPSMGNHCRFYPSCSQYTLEAIQKYGIFKGCLKGLKRILKCHPLNLGGVDIP